MCKQDGRIDGGDDDDDDEEEEEYEVDAHRKWKMEEDLTPSSIWGMDVDFNHFSF